MVVVRMGLGLVHLVGDASLLSNLLLDDPGSLVEVHLVGCASKWRLDLSPCTGLVTATITDCSALSVLLLQGCMALTTLAVAGCPRLMAADMSGCAGLASLSLADCASLQEVGGGRLDVSGCTTLLVVRVVACGLKEGAVSRAIGALDAAGCTSPPMITSVGSAFRDCLALTLACPFFRSV